MYGKLSRQKERCEFYRNNRKFDIMIADVLNKLEVNETLSHADLKYLLSLEDPKDIEILKQKAYEIKVNVVGKKVHFRGIIEFSNVCTKDCYYCGIRKSNSKVERFTMQAEEILSAAEWAYENAYGSMVLQSGERSDDNFVRFIEDILVKVRDKTSGRLGVTLSLGEQSLETYQRWFEAGAHRYLLRIESSNPELYSALHPEDHNFQKRKESLNLLRQVGYQVGTGVMVGLPGQTLDDLANDILFFEENDIDMIGMGPYIPHADTPMASSSPSFEEIKSRQLRLGLNMIAATRIYLKDTNIAATTALQALHPNGREMGVLAGANIIMPNMTETQYRSSYQLYDGKPCLDENSSMCRGCLDGRIRKIGEEVGYNEWGDSPHFFSRKQRAEQSE